MSIFKTDLEIHEFITTVFFNISIINEYYVIFKFAYVHKKSSIISPPPNYLYGSVSGKTPGRGWRWYTVNFPCFR
jgi:hypothetical protein